MTVHWRPRVTTALGRAIGAFGGTGYFITASASKVAGPIARNKVAGPIARNQHARWPTPWRVVFCEKMKNQARDGGGMSFPLGLTKMAIVTPQAARASA